MTSAKRYAGGTISNPSDPVYARHFEYTYDPIGNRETYEVSQGTATTYTTNELNQYTATADPSESFTYDDDGNLTQDGTYTYVWDAENRLIEAYPTNPTTGSQKCVMVYDYMNRRVKRTLYDWTGSAWSATPSESRIFLYDGWNVLLSYNPAASMAIDREFTWGLDVSGQNGNPSVAGIHGAGGIGGLVAARRVGSPTKAYFCFYDANGNLSDCVKNTDGTLWTHVQYDPYGGPIVASDAGGLGHPFRYSTKYWDGVLGAYYYGYRHFDPTHGRWGSRDPSGESYTLNHLAFVFNSPVTHMDNLGLVAFSYLRQAPGPESQPAQQKPVWHIFDGNALFSGTIDASTFVGRLSEPGLDVIAALWIQQVYTVRHNYVESVKAKYGLGALSHTETIEYHVPVVDVSDYTTTIPVQFSVAMGIEYSGPEGQSLHSFLKTYNKVKVKGAFKVRVQCACLTATARLTMQGSFNVSVRDNLVSPWKAYMGTASKEITKTFTTCKKGKDIVEVGTISGHGSDSQAVPALQNPVLDVFGLRVNGGLVRKCLKSELTLD